jgi:hypothetical protein
MLSPEDMQWLQAQRQRQMQRQQSQARYPQQRRPQQPQRPQQRPMNPSNDMGAPLPRANTGPAPTGNEQMRTMEWNPQRDLRRQQPGYDPYQERARQAEMQYRQQRQTRPIQEPIGGSSGFIPGGGGGVGAQMGSPGQPPVQNWAFDSGRANQMRGQMEAQTQEEKNRQMAQQGASSVGAGADKRARKVSASSTKKSGGSKPTMKKSAGKPPAVAPKGKRY